MAGISSKAVLKAITPYKANGGSEFEEEGSLDYYNTFYRKYDAQIGRFTGIDIKAESFERLSPFQFGNNNPVFYNDPMGDKFVNIKPADPMANTFAWALSYRSSIVDDNPSMKISSMWDQIMAGTGGGSAAMHAYENTLTDEAKALINQLSNALYKGNVHLDENWDIASNNISQGFMDLFNGSLHETRNAESNSSTNSSESSSSAKVWIMVWDTQKGDVGHVAVRVGNIVFGYYPTDLNGNGAYEKDDLKNSPGEMHINSIDDFNKKYKGDGVTYFQVGLTDKQTSSLTTAIENFAVSPGMYSVSGLNCTSVAILSFGYAGINFMGQYGGVYSAQYATPYTFGIALGSVSNANIINGIRHFTVGQ